jgi:hypothetical protein
MDANLISFTNVCHLPALQLSFSAAKLRNMDALSKVQTTIQLFQFFNRYMPILFSLLHLTVP